MQGILLNVGMLGSMSLPLSFSCSAAVLTLQLKCWTDSHILKGLIRFMVPLFSL